MKFIIKTEKIVIPTGVTVESKARVVTIKGPKGTLKKSFKHIKAEIEAKGYPVELGIVQRTGACGPIDSIYLRDADENLVEISVYKE